MGCEIQILFQNDSFNLVMNLKNHFNIFGTYFHLSAKGPVELKNIACTSASTSVLFNDKDA